MQKDYFSVLKHRDLLFNDFGDRVAQLLHVESVVPFWQSRNSNIHNQVLIVNTHLLFPHDANLSIVRLNQVRLFCCHMYRNHFFVFHLESYQVLFLALNSFLVTGVQDIAVCRILPRRA